MTITIERLPKNIGREQFEAISDFLAAYGMRDLPAPPDFQRAKINAWGAFQQGMTFIAKRQQREIVGILAMVRAEEGWALPATQECLVDFFFYVLPSARGEGIAEELMSEARKLKEETGLRAYIFNRLAL